MAAVEILRRRESVKRATEESTPVASASLAERIAIAIFVSPTPYQNAESYRRSILGIVGDEIVVKCREVDIALRTLFKSR
jgi:hypothetical protein